MTEQEFAGEMKLILLDNRDGLKRIYEAYAPYVYNTALSILKDPEGAKDITSDFFLRLWNKSDTYDPNGRHKGWIAAIVRNMCLDLLRRNGRTEYTLDSPDSPDIPDTSVSVEDAVASKQGFLQALDALPTAEREILNLRFAGEMTIAEISKTLGVAQGTVAWRLRNALQRLKNTAKEGQL